MGSNTDAVPTAVQPSSKMEGICVCVGLLVGLWVVCFVCVCMYVVFCVCLHVCGVLCVFACMWTNAHIHGLCAVYMVCAPVCTSRLQTSRAQTSTSARANKLERARTHTHTHTHTRTMTHIHRCDNMRCSMCDGVFRWGMLHNTTQGVVAQHAPPSTRQPSTSVAASAMNL
jgi:hypothetical protein